MRQNYRLIQTPQQLEILLAECGENKIRRCAFQGLDLPEECMQHIFDNCIFLACKLPHGLKRQLTNSLVFPNMGELFQFRTTLYTADSLYEGYELGRPESLANCYDSRVYRHYLDRGKICADIKETLARTLHDHSISQALHQFLSTYEPRNIVGIMGGHGISRADAQYEKVARLSKRLTEAGKLMISGGGPGAMEATHLGAWMAGRSEDELLQALEILRQAPCFQDANWLECAMQVRERFPQSQYESVGVPTWLYGHEPATPLATRIAKYFDNSIREDGILRLAFGGIIYTPGSAGTLQEIFQDAVQNHYLSFGFASPMAFMGVDYWMHEVPIYPLLQDMMARGKYKNLLLSISDDEQQIAQTILDF